MNVIDLFDAKSTLVQVAAWCRATTIKSLSGPMLTQFLQSVLTKHYNDVIMSTMASQITSLTSVYPTVYSGADQRKHQSSASLAFVLGIHRSPFDDVITGLNGMISGSSCKY